jgi:hypothetical protein
LSDFSRREIPPPDPPSHRSNNYSVHFMQLS